MVLLEHAGSGGRRRCDATCHHARHSKCRCICGGRFHGLGTRPGALQQAVAEFAETVLAGLGVSGEDLAALREHMVRVARAADDAARDREPRRCQIALQWRE